MKKAIIILAGMALFSYAFRLAEERKTSPEIAVSKLNPVRATPYLTAKDTKDRLTKGEPLKFEELSQPDEAFPTIMVDPEKQFQVIEGFGGALTDAAAETLYKLPKEKQEEVLNSYFSVENGIGYSLCRTNINSCDFSSDSYAYDEVAGDTELEHFSIDHDRKFKIPLIKAALKITGNNLKLFASPWSPPAWMKTNNDMLHGGKVKPEYLDVWANYYVKFINEYAKEGIPVWGLTVQNEPMAVQTWESCLFTGEEECQFVKNHLGPTLVKNNLSKVNLMIWDHNRGIMYQRAKAVYDDPEAAKYVWGMGFHWYVGDHFENVRLVHDAYPDKKLIFTEGTPASYNVNKLQDWQWGEKYGEAIIMDINSWAAGWTDWNILLDERGGPNHVGNFCLAPVHGNTITGELTFTNSYYYIGHFSKFVRPGAKRIACTSDNDRLLSTAFINPDGKVVVVVMNKSERNINFKTWINGKAVQSSSPAHSIITLVING